MVKKKCPNCNQDSFSATVSGKWICPHCKTDLTKVPSNDIKSATIDALTGCLIDTFGTNMDAAAINNNLLKPDKGDVPCSVSGTGLNRDEALNRGRKILGFLNWPYEVVQVKKKFLDCKNGLGVDLWELRFAGKLGEAHIRLDGGNGEVWFINCDSNDTLENATIPSLENLDSHANHLLEICLPHRVGRMVQLECALPRDYRKTITSVTPLPGAKWSQTYIYIETVNGIPVLNNQVTITLCGNTGRLQSLNRHWLASDTFFPDNSRLTPTFQWEE